MKKVLMTMAIAALLVGSLSFTALAHGAGSGQGQGRNKGQVEKNGFFANLNLTTGQRQKMLEIREAFAKDTLDLRFNIRKRNLELRELWGKKPLDQKAIEAKTKEATALRVQMIKKADAMDAKIKAILTPEQQKRLAEREANRKPGMNGFGRNGGDGMGMRGMGY